MQNKPSQELRPSSRFIRNTALLLVVAQIGVWQLTRAPRRIVHADSKTQRIYIDRGRQYNAVYKGSSQALQAMSSHQASALALAAEDFDADGMKDLAVGFAAPGGGLVAIHRGNLDAFAPQSDASFWAIGRGEFPSPYLPEAQLVEIPSRPDFLASGDFIGLDVPAVAAAARGGNQIHVVGRGKSGNIELLQSIAVPGSITALDSHALRNGKYGHVLVGVHNTSGSQLLIYRGSPQGLSLVSSHTISGDATSFALGYLDGDAVIDTLMVAGGKVLIHHGGSQTIDSIPLAYTVSTAVIGRFLHDRAAMSQIALLATDGSLHILAHSGLDSRPYTPEERSALRRAAKLPTMRKSNAAPLVEHAIEWKEVENYSRVAVADGSGRPPLMFAGRISSNGTHDVVLLSAAKMTVLAHPDVNPNAGVVMERGDLGADAVAALPLVVNIDSRPGVVFMRRGETVPHVMMPLPDPTFIVNTTTDLVSGNPNACLNNVSGQCSLREAILEANANGGSDTIMLSANTYTLTLPRVSGDFSGQHGTLEITDTVSIVGQVDGNGNPTSIIQAGTAKDTTASGANDVDKILSINQDITVSSTASATLTNLELRFGHNRGDCCSEFDGFGGAFDFDIDNSTATLTITNCNIHDNTVFSGQGGGFAIFNTGGSSASGGTASVSNSTIQNNDTTPDSNGNAGDGGGIEVAAEANITLTNTKVLNNTAHATGGTNATGGGIRIDGESGLSARSAIHGGSIQGNSAAGDGGGILNEAALTLDQGVVISGNTSGGDGGGLYNNNSSPDTTSISKITISGNSATVDGGGIFTGNNSGAQPISISFSRLAGNSAAAGSNLYNDDTAITSATDNWWGTNSPAATITTTSNGSTTFDPFIVLTNVASPNLIKQGQTSSLTASFLQDNHNTPISASNLAVLIGLPLSGDIFSPASPAHGSISNDQHVIQSNGQATETYTATSAPGIDTIDATVDAAVVPATIAVLAPPSIAKAFGATHIPVFTSTPTTTPLTFTITNPNTANSLSGLAFTDILPAGLAVANTPGVTNTCGGTATATAGSGTISLSVGAVGQGGSCTIAVNVKGVADGVQNNTTGNVTATDAGGLTGNAASASITVINPPTISKVFNPTSITLNGTSTLTFTITNTNVNSILNGIAFLDSLPAGVTVASSTGTVCGGTLTTTNPSTISLTGATIANNAQCQFSVTVTGATSGVKTNTTGNVTSTDAGGLTGNTASASLTVVAAPSIAKAFNPTTIALNATSSLTFTITNPNGGLQLTGVGFTDSLPTGLSVASSTATVCGGTLTTTNPTAISLTGATIAASGQCQFSMTITGAAAGQFTNTTGAVTSNEAGTGNTASASITVVAAPSMVKTFSPTVVVVNGTSTMTITITNPSGNSVAEAGVAFSDTFPAGLVVAAPNGLSNTCNGAVSAIAGTGLVSLTGGAIAVNSSCTVTVNVTPTTGGVFTNTAGPVSSTNGGTGNPATASITTGGSLGGSFGAKSGPLGSRQWIVNIGNGTAGAAVNAQVTSLTLTQTLGAACTPVISGLPAAASPNPIPPGQTGQAPVTIDFSSCTGRVFFKAVAAVSADGGAVRGTITALNQLP